MTWMPPSCWPQLDIAELKLIMKIGLLLYAVEPGFHCVRTHWIRGFHGVPAGSAHTHVMLMVPA